MIPDFLLVHRTWMPLVVLVGVAVCVVVGHVVRSRRARWLLVLLSALPALALTVVPIPNPAARVGCVVQFFVPTLRSIELLANVALFFPPVYFAALATRRPLLTLAVATGASAAIEAFQALAPVIGRACDTNDWAMNTVGAVVAVLLASVLRRSPSRDEDGEGQAVESRG